MDSDPPQPPKIVITEQDLDYPNCPYCGDDIEGEQPYYCPACGVPHHKECWEENGGCTGYGCSEAPVHDPSMTTSTHGINTESGEDLKEQPSGMIWPILVSIWAIYLSAPLWTYVFSIVAMFHSFSALNRNAEGDYENAKKEFEKAIGWAIAGAIFVLFFN